MAANPPAYPHTVLIVDDDEDNLTALLMYLEAAGFTVAGASSAAEALGRLRGGFQPCALLLDVVMPQIDGWKLVERMRADPALAATKVVLYSGLPVDEPRARALGVSAYLMKPADPAEIATALAQHCPRH